MVQVAVLQQAKQLAASQKAPHRNWLVHLPSPGVEPKVPVIDGGHHEVELRLELGTAGPW